jgi:SAM-dependent methyltransferase
VQRGFPLDLLGFVCCPSDGAELKPDGGSRSGFLADGAGRCVRCGRSYGIRAGVLSLLDAVQLHPESAHEMRSRNERNGAILDGTRAEWSSAAAEAIETRPTLEAVKPASGQIVCELGCGAGRYTLALAASASALVAVDFSLSGLQVLRQKLGPDAPVALVQADVTRPYGPAGAFHRILSTLHSNLPGRDYRTASLREIGRTLRADGRAVISMHHYGLRDIMSRVPATGRYADSGIYRHLMTVRESRDEASAFFARLHHLHISVSVPGVRSRMVSGAAARVPLVRSSLGRLFLAICEQPRCDRAIGIPQCA